MAAGGVGKPGGEAPGVVEQQELQSLRAMLGAGGGQHQHTVLVVVVVVARQVLLMRVKQLL